MLDTLAERIHDGRFLNLIRGALKAGYLEDWKWHPTLSGSPQGGIISPILANVYLDRLDKFVGETLLPTYNRGKQRRKDRRYSTLQSRESQARLGGKREKAKLLRAQMQSIPCLDPYDPDFRRLRYVRYADDFLLGFAGPHQEAKEIKQKIKEFLQDTLKLELSEQKTVITNARSDTARFLGYDVHVMHSDTKRTAGRRAVNGKPGLRVPYTVITEKCSRYMQNGKPIHRKELLNNSVYDIIRQYQHEYRGFVEYYRLAYNLCQVGRLQHVMEVSLVKTLAHKLKISVPQVYRRYEFTLQTEDGPRKTLRVTVERTVERAEEGKPGKPPLVAQWGNVTLKWNKRAIIRDPSPFPWDKRTQLVERLLADTCELCGSGEDVEVHHIRHLKDLQTKGQKEKPQHIQVMAARRRKTLVVCRACHNDIHKGRSTVAPIPRTPRKPKMPEMLNILKNTGEPDDAKVSNPVRRGADGKVPQGVLS